MTSLETGGRTRLRTWAFALLMLAALLVPAASASAESCNCPKVGAYKAPASEGVQIDAQGKSPNDVYQVTASGPGSAPNVTIKKLSNNSTVFSSTLPGGSQWGFSPDDDRFVYHYLNGGVHNVVLLNLAKSGNKQVWQTSVLTGSSRLRFSPDGKYFLYTYIFGPFGSSTTNMEMRNAATGAAEWSTAFANVGPPGSAGDSFGIAGYGFGPDDHGFVLAHVTGANSVDLMVRNLDANTTPIQTTLTGPSAFWGFSPCGDVFGLVNQVNASFLDISTRRISNGSTVGSAGGIPIGPTSLSQFTANLTQHQIVVSGNVHPLGANTADNACATGPALSNLAVAPSAVTGGSQNPTGTVQFSAAPSSSQTVNLSSSDTTAATVPATVSISGTSKTFSVTSKVVSSQKSVTLTATHGGVTKTTTLTVNPTTPPPAVSNLTLNPTSVLGGNQSTGTVTLDRNAPPGGTQVTLLSNHPAATVPANVTIPSGNSTGAFTIGTGEVLVNTPVQITARLGGADTNRTLTVQPNNVPSGGGAVRRVAECVNGGFLSRNDDGSTGVIGLPFSLNFFGADYDALWVNNNGNVTFDGSLSTFTPFNLTSTSSVIIAPFFADVDTRNFASGVVTYGQTMVNGRTAFCANWTGVDYGGVGYYNSAADKKNSFQVLLIDRSDTGMGNFDIEMNYDFIRWETGSASGGFNGFGGSSARAGYSNGDPSNPQASFELPGSAVNGAFLDSAPTGLSRNSRNAQEPGRYLFQVRNGAPPTGGRISGRVNGPSGPLAFAPVQVCRDGGSCINTRSNSQGNYNAAGLPDGDYSVRASGPVGSGLSSAEIGPLTIASANVLSDQDLTLTGPVGPPPGTDIQPSTGNGQGLPSVYWHSATTLTTTGCPGGTATYEIRRAGNVIAGGAMTEGPPGSYSGSVPPLAPNTGVVDVHIAIDCPEGTPDETRDFNIYIDPSGNVRTMEGDPIEGATVTLYRSDDEAGPYSVVPNGSDIMSPANRQNPDTTDADGHFGWDTIAGYYKVRAQADGCVNPDDPSQEWVETGALEIPPPVTDIDLRLDCASEEADETPPTITIDSPTDTTYALGQAVAASFGCDDGDGSGIATCTATTAGGENVDTGSAGTKTFTVEASDNAGNTATKSVSYRVLDLKDGRMVSNAKRGGATFASNVDCPAALANARNRPFQVAWSGGTFKMTRVLSVACFNDAGWIPSPVPATMAFDTQDGTATGNLNGVPGYTITWRFEDHGAPSTADAARLKITRDSDGATVLDVPLGALSSGQNYAMPAI